MAIKTAQCNYHLFYNMFFNLEMVNEHSLKCNQSNYNRKHIYI